jgi:hypothetical protein
MKKIIIVLVLAICLIIAGCKKEAKAQDLNISLKQGFVYSWQDQAVKNLTTLEIAKTKPIASWGKWNALIDGWTIDIGYAYDATTSNIGAILLGREFGTLGKYLPIDFPLLDKLSVTLYPFGIYLEDVFNSPRAKFCSGVGIIKLSLKF